MFKILKLLALILLRKILPKKSTKLNKKIEKEKSFVFTKLLDNKTVNNRLQRLIEEQRLHGVTYYEKIAKTIKMGRHSYIGDYSTVASKDTKIGSFCSIADNVSIGTTFHPTHFLSTHPFTYFEYMKLMDNAKQCEWNFVTPVIIGNDVWVGKNVVIMDGVSIGDGAIIGSSAVVTHDVPPYAIIVGVPGKILKYRFNQKQIYDLLQIKWWDLSDEEINNLSFSDIDECIRELKEIRGIKE